MFWKIFQIKSEKKKWESNLDKMKHRLKNAKLVLNYQFLWEISIVYIDN